MDPILRPDASQPNGLLAALAGFGLVVQAEVALTRSIAWLLGLDGACDALDDLVRRCGPEPDPNGFWRAEVVAADRTRTDLEYAWGDPPRTRVVVEAKIGHLLTVEQVAHYLGRLEDDALLVVLVPEARLPEARRVVQQIRERSTAPEHGQGPVRLDVWTYGEVTAAIDTCLPGSPDVAQFKGLVAAVQAQDIAPFKDADLLDDNPTRRDDIWRVVDEASYGLFGKKRPSGSDAGFEHRRYIQLIPHSTSFAVGVGRRTRSGSGAQPWAWVRVQNTTEQATTAQSVLKSRFPWYTLRDDDGLWLPLDIPTGASGSEMIHTVRDQLEFIGAAIRDEIDRDLDGA